MASGDTAIVDVVKKEEQNYIRLNLLIVKLSAFVLKAVFDYAVPPAQLHNKLQQVIGKTNYGKNKKIISDKQYNLLYPPQGPPNSKTFDITLLVYMLRNICDIDRKCKFWAEKDNNNIADTEVDEVADIVRIRNIRNEIQHAPTASLDQKYFDAQWDMIEEAMLRLGTKYNLTSLKSEIETVKNQPFESVKEKVIIIMQSHDLDDDYGYFMDDRFDDDYDFDDGRSDTDDIEHDRDYEDHDIYDIEHDIDNGDHDIDDIEHDIDNEDHDIDDIEHDIDNEDHDIYDIEHDIHNEDHDIDDIEHDIDNKDHDIDDIEHDIDNEDHDIDDIEHDIDNEDHDIDDIEHDIDNEDHDIDDIEHDIDNEDHDIDDIEHDIDNEDHGIDDIEHDIDNEDHDIDDIEHDIDNEDHGIDNGDHDIDDIDHDIDYGDHDIDHDILYDREYEIHDAADSYQEYDDHDDYDIGGDYD